MMYLAFTVVPKHLITVDEALGIKERQHHPLCPHVRTLTLIDPGLPLFKPRFGLTMTLLTVYWIFFKLLPVRASAPTSSWIVVIGMSVGGEGTGCQLLPVS
jgi:hypothetical protein